MTDTIKARGGCKPAAIDLDRVVDLISRGANRAQLTAGLGIAPRTIYARMRSSPDLQEAVSADRRQSSDFTVALVHVKTVNGSWPAIRALMAMNAGMLTR